ncbi:MAG: UDP-N-acetylmuramate dehydrogenase [Polaribacter sp.]|jgi:UDP-N-acetylmuramate dehydrogenase
MNRGSQLKGIGDHIETVETVTASGEIKKHSQQECLFYYRSSIFQNTDEIIVSATFIFEKGAYTSIRKEMLEILSSRRKKFSNCGSVFVSNPALYADYGPPSAIIEQCNLKGIIKGGACISPLHANFIVNTGNSTAKDILFLIHLAKISVIKKTDYDMPAEARYISTAGKVIPAHIKVEEIWKHSL